MVVLRRIRHVTAGLLTVIFLTVLAPPPQTLQVTDNAVLAEQVPTAGREAFLKAHPGLAAATLDRDPSVVAGWWQSLRPEQRYSVVQRMPEIVGNLAGVDYASRDAANRVQLTRALAELLDQSTFHTLSDVEGQQLAALRAIEGALIGRSIPRYLIELTTDSPPLAAISVGNLDTARIVTFAVPGMGTFSTDMQLWTRAASNLYHAQSAAGAHKQAVIAWMGYRTPPVGVEATRDTYANRGAQLLRRDIVGIRASRDTAQQPVINIVAHSYGTTTAAKALSPELDVRTLVMLGSSGVDSSVRTADDLAADAVFSGESSADLQARWGRLERTNPSSRAFGATILSVDGDGADLKAVTGHEPILHSPWNDDPESPLWVSYANVKVRERLYADHMESFGYLDVGTESLVSVGVVTTPPTYRDHSLGHSTITRGIDSRSEPTPGATTGSSALRR